jgi:hypothetical protein
MARHGCASFNWTHSARARIDMPSTKKDVVQRKLSKTKLVGVNGEAINCRGACMPTGDRLIDLSGKIPRGVQYIDFVVSVEPFYTRLYMYQLGYPDSLQQCCSNKATSVLRVPVGAGRFCVRQSQPQMKWHMRALARPDVEL